ncbi:MAG: diguanylate cyclase, partial [Devosia sp.]
MSVIDFFLRGHDPSLVVLAAIVCLVSSYACVGLLRHAHRTEGRMRLTWTVVAALAVGFGIWATHFVAVLAFRAGFTLSYDIGLTAASLAIAILVCGTGIAMAIRGASIWDHFLGGAVVGVAISSMHYAGIAALVMGGDLAWNPAMIATSILAGIVLGGLAFVSAMGAGTGRLLGGAGLLTLAICVMHFTAMGAADFSRCFPLSADAGIHGGWLATALAFISVLILSAALGSVLLDEADRRRTARETERQSRDAERIDQVTTRLELAMTHMAQGLGLYDADGTLQLYNARLPQLLGLDPDRDLTGLSFSDICRLTIVGPGETPPDLEDTVDGVLAQHMPLIQGKGGEIVHTFADDRTLRISHSPVGDGSWVSTVDDITERQRSAAAIAHLARHDVLTGLPNRALFNERFAAALANAEETDNNLAVIAIDLDRFKEVNDSYGHAAGDVVLTTLATRLSEGLKDGEMIARLGGDEFAALKSFISMDALREFLARLEAALFTRLTIDGSSINTGGSIGVAIYPEDGADRSKLLNNADLAMYRAKAEFDRRVAYYESEMDEHARQRRDMAR